MEPLTDIAHTIQVALTPVFLLSGIGSLINVFNTRLARVSDHSEHLNELIKTARRTSASATASAASRPASTAAPPRSSSPSPPAPSARA